MDSTNMQEMIRVIKDAGLYETNMPKEQIEQYYKAVVDSKDTSFAEMETQRSNSPEDIFALDLDLPTQTSSPEKELIETQKENNGDMFRKNIKSYSKKTTDRQVFDKDDLEQMLEDEPEDATKAFFSFDDMPKDNGPPLEIIYHPPKYINIQNSTGFIEADVYTRAKMLYKYHTEMEKARAKASRLSLFPAPRPKPIDINFNFNYEPITDTEETYISRSGRQTKRKIYTDDDDFVTSSPTKKTKPKTTEKEKPKWQSKTKPIKKTDTSTESMETETNETTQKEIPKTTTPRIKKMSNAEIMQRSKIFADSPIRRPTRYEKIFDKLKEVTLHKKDEKAREEAFVKTLDCDSDSEQSQNQKETVEDAIQVTDEEYPKRVIPPVITRRKPIHSKAQQQKSNAKTISQPKEDNLFEEAGPSKSQSDTSSSFECPICRKLFSKNSIEEHASNCGEEQIITRTHSRSKITCPICDKVIATNYDSHVSECRQSLEELDNKGE